MTMLIHTLVKSGDAIKVNSWKNDFCYKLFSKTPNNN